MSDRTTIARRDANFITRPLIGLATALENRLCVVLDALPDVDDLERLPRPLGPQRSAQVVGGSNHRRTELHDHVTGLEACPRRRAVRPHSAQTHARAG